MILTRAMAYNQAWLMRFNLECVVSNGVLDVGHVACNVAPSMIGESTFGSGVLGPSDRSGLRVNDCSEMEAAAA